MKGKRQRKRKRPAAAEKGGALFVRSHAHSPRATRDRHMCARAEHPYPTLLEIFADYMYNKFGRAEAAEGGATAATAPAAAKHSADRAPTKSSSSKVSRTKLRDIMKGMNSCVSQLTLLLLRSHSSVQCVRD